MESLSYYFRLLALLLWLLLHLCSGHQRTSRIVNGQPAPDSRFRYQVSVQSTVDDYHLCSGVILDGSHVLTTAACCENDDPFLLKVVAGTHDLSQEEGTVMLMLESVTIHEDYDAFSLYNNICIMKMDGDLSNSE